MRRGLVLAACCLLAAACGGGSSATGAAASPTPNPSPSPQPTGACAPSASCMTFALHGVNGAAASGTIHLTASSGPGSLTIELVIQGLQAGSSHISHVHSGSCSAVGGIVFALNQVVADGQGNADVKTTVPQTFPPTGGASWYVVVHQGPDLQGPNAAYLLCGNLA